MTPTSTYRLQLHRGFGFRDAAAVVPYLADLGVSHVYCSPVLTATPGSAHGYDVVDHSRLSEELGGDPGWAELVETCREHGLGLVVDIVPNHMAIPAPERLNAALWDVLEHGQDSAYAHWFDVDWEAGDGGLVLPILGDEGAPEPDAEVLRYGDHELPRRGRYRLVHWRDGGNYRRFFDIPTLIGLRVEDADVFAATHARVLDLVQSGEVTGLRVDHPDGLADPAAYLDRLAIASNGIWTVAEKILEPGERLPASWRCAGTTGYDALAAVSQVLLDAAGEAPLTELYAEVTGEAADPHALVEESKRVALERLFASDLERLVRQFGDDSLRPAVAELLVQLDVYRCYPDDPASAHRLDEAAARAEKARPELAEDIERAVGLLERDRALRSKFDQLSGPVMAKGVEDTAFYRYHRLAALNEVGNDMTTFGWSVPRFHDFCRRQLRDWPDTMTTLSTHDTKRSEDVRARLLVLAELPGEWRETVMSWPRFEPDPAAGYLLWQSVVGAWPIDTERVHAFMEKAVREAKLHTSWTEVDAAYEGALHAFVDAVFADRSLLGAVDRFVSDVLEGPGTVNTLAQKLVQLTMPGVPDVYQGQELVEPSLVDPDNRRPVDFERRRRALARPEGKLLVTASALRLRRELPDVFRGGYTPVEANGPAASHLLAFARDGRVVTVATRLPAGLRARGGWGDTTLELDGHWHDVLTGRDVVSMRLADLLDQLPVALLLRRLR